MQCFYHRDTADVCTCKNCGRGLCPSCAVDVANGVACGRELAVLTRSVIQMTNVLSSHADVPAGDVADARALPGWESAAPGLETRHKFRVRCTREKPKDAFVAVPYRDQWFWIDDRDLASKRHFAFVMFLFTLADTGDRGAEPVLTIPT